MKNLETPGKTGRVGRSASLMVIIIFLLFLLFSGHPKVRRLIEDV